MATLTTGDIKTVDELSEIGKDQLSNEDSLLTFDKDMNAHKKLKVSALKALMLENSNGAAGSEAAAAASAEDSAASALAASTSATNAATSASASAASAANSASSASDAGSSAVLAESWAVGGTGTRQGEDTNNSMYYASQAASTLDEVRESLATGGLVEGHRTVVVDADMASLADVDTTFRIQGNATLTVRDTTVFGVRIAIINETGSPQAVSLLLGQGRAVIVIAAGQSWKFVWTGYWNDGVGIAPAVTAGDSRPVSSDAVAKLDQIYSKKARSYMLGYDRYGVSSTVVINTLSAVMLVIVPHCGSSTGYQANGLVSVFDIHGQVSRADLPIVYATQAIENPPADVITRRVALLKVAAVGQDTVTITTNAPGVDDVGYAWFCLFVI